MIIQAVKLIIKTIPGTDLRLLLRSSASDKYAPALVSKKTEITIDGFPRTANTFVYYKVQLAFPNTKISHHTHSWQNFMFSRILGVPSILMLRDPDLAVNSLQTKIGGNTALHYLDYCLMNFLAGAFASEIWTFEALTAENGVDAFIASLSERLQEAPQAPTAGEFQHLMSTRTKHKNVGTPEFDENNLSQAAGMARALAKRVHGRLRERA